MESYILLRMPRLRLIRISVVVLAWIAVACSAADRSDPIGSWAMSIDGGADTLLLYSAGVYTRTFVGPSTPNGAIDTGRWRLTRNKSVVSLGSLTNRWPEHGRFDPKLGWHMPDTSVRSTFALTINRRWTGTTTLDLMPEKGWRYRRVEAPRKR